MTLNCYEQPGLVTIAMEENRSAGHPVLRWAVMGWMGLVFVIAGVTLVHGAWLVAVFEVVMPLSLMVALDAHRRIQPAHELLTLRRGQVYHEVITATGVNRRSMVLLFCRLERPRRGDNLLLVDRVASRVIGRCLCEHEREELILILSRHGVRCRARRH